MSVYTLVGERNYSPFVVRVRNLIELPGLDNLRGVSVNGYMALVSKDTPLDSLMVAFPAECQLAPEFASSFNLFRHSEKNQDPSQAGYLEDHGRIKALKLRGHVSSCLLLPVWAPDMAEGMEFDTIDGQTISWKYVPPVKGNPRTAPSGVKVWKRVDAKYLPEHVDTLQYLRVSETIPGDTHIIVSQKLHGTSLRAGNVPVRRKLTWFDKLLQRFGVQVKEWEYDYVYGSRKVIKDANNPNQNHFYDTDLWTTTGKQVFDGLIPRNVIVYAEVVGWVPGTNNPIQKGYTYDVPVGEAHVYVYRVSVVTEDAHQYDLGDEGMRAFCAERGLRVVPKLWEGTKEEFEPEFWLDTHYYPDWSEAVPLAKASPCDEGVVVRVEGVVPKFYKVKSPLFFAHESALLDSGEADMETVGGGE